jgi:DNA-binding transcriptional MerR regulator
MLRIGDFSQLAQISVPTLRHYDELGLLKPAHVDKFTDYRYYTVEQLPRLNRILALKDLGLSLDQINRLLKDDVPPAQLRGMLAMKRAEIEQQIANEQARLARVEARLQQVEEEGVPLKYEVVMKKIEAQVIAGIRQTVPHVSQMGDLRYPALHTLYDWLKVNGVTDFATEMMIYHNPEYTDENIEMEAAVVLGKHAIKATAKLPPHARVRLRELPAVQAMATTIHHGSLFDIPRSIIALFSWLGTNRYRSAGPIRELHLYGREVDLPDDADDIRERRVVLEMQVPVERE